jgi:hypothetical protein
MNMHFSNCHHLEHLLCDCENAETENKVSSVLSTKIDRERWEAAYCATYIDPILSVSTVLVISTSYNMNRTYWFLF